MPFSNAPLSYPAHTRLIREIAGLSGLPLHEKLTRALATAMTLLDLDLGFLSRIRDGVQTIEAVAPVGASLKTGDVFRLEDSYCAITVEAAEVVAIDEMGQSPYTDRPCYEAFGLEAYIGAPVVGSGVPYGTIAFASSTPRSVPFSEADRSLVELLATWLGTTIERMQADAAHRRTEHRLASVLNAAPDAVVRTDLNRVIEYVNPSFERIFGWTAAEVVGKSTAFLYANPEDFETQGEARYGDAPRSRLHDEPYVVPYRRADGTTFLGETVGGPAEEDGDLPQRFLLGFIRDVTAREAARAEAEAAADAKAEAARSKERFLANMSHEMRTPLNAVLGLGHLLSQTPLSPDQKGLLDGVTTSADALLNLIDDLLDFARLGAGQLPFETIPFRPSEIAASVRTILRIRADAQGLDLRVVVSDSVPDRVLGDPTRFRQILTNLASNAVKFTAEGSVTIDLDVTTADGKDWLQIRVSDTGIGIPANRLAAIFDPFTQAADDAARRFGGTGLGLAIVKDLVERQDGTIAVESVEGEGSTFTVTLPAVVPSASVSGDRPEADGTSADLAGLHVLLVEDNEMNRLVGRRTLEMWGVRVTEARDGHEAIDEVAKASAAGALHDLVLMDLQMPGLDGIEATRHIRGTLGLQTVHLPIIALTASVLAYQQADVVDAGLDAFLLKPFVPDVLRREIANWTGRGPAESLDPEALSTYTLGDTELMERVTTLFFTDGRRSVEAMAVALRKKDYELLETSAHSLKGQAGYVGAIGLSETAERIVQAIHGGETSGLGEDVRTALRQYRNAKDELRRLQTSPRSTGVSL